MTVAIRFLHSKHMLCLILLLFRWQDGYQVDCISFGKGVWSVLYSKVCVCVCAVLICHFFCCSMILFCSLLLGHVCNFFFFIEYTNFNPIITIIITIL
jgi:hypothetical protein